VLILGSGAVERRWADLENKDTAGSGRVALWETAAGIYLEHNERDRILGVGIVRCMDEIRTSFGVRIHTHSDWLDILLAYGGIGILAWLFLQAAVLRRVCRSHNAGSAGVMAVCVFLTMFVEGVFTGQMWAPHVMVVYLMGIEGLTARVSGVRY
jgi:O-antigen ligase